MKHHRLLMAVSVAIVAALAVTAGCGRNQEKLMPVAYRLKWLYNISVAGDLYGQEHGFFAREGLAVEVKAGGPERDAIKELEIGHAQFGAASADQVLRAAAKGSPVQVIAQLFQTNPLQWLYRTGKTRIASPEDLKGKTIGITYGGNDETIMRALLAKHGIREDEVRFFSVRYDYNPFYQGEVDLWPVYRNAEGIVIAERLAQAGEEVGFFSPDRFGIHFVANSVIATKQMIAEHPQIVAAFRRALLAAWQEALEPVNAEKTVATVRNFDRNTPAETIGRQLAVTRELMLPASGARFGTIDTAAWQQTAQIMLEQKLIAAPMPVEGILIDGLD